MDHDQIITFSVDTFDPARCPVLTKASVRAARRGQGPARQCPYRPPEGDAFCIMHQESIRRAGRLLFDQHPDACGPRS